MNHLKAGDVVTIDFPGVDGVKRRPAIVVSSETYHQHRPDIIVGIVTAQIQTATAPTDHVLRDWAQASLHRPSAFRAFLATLPAAAATRIGSCSQRDWTGITKCLEKAIAHETDG